MRIPPAAVLLLALAAACARAADITEIDLSQRFDATVRPFLNTYCIECHKGEKPKGDLNLEQYRNLAAVVDDYSEWATALEKIEGHDMPSDKAKRFPTDDERAQIVAWIRDVRTAEGHKNAGDPGVVLARRLSNAEYNYTIRDLTGVDLQPAREFPVDPANQMGFDNTGESLAMSPTLLNKYLKAARSVADNLVLRPQGIAFAPHPMLVETDRDKYCVNEIVEFYHRQPTDYADYFYAAWRFKHRAALGEPNATLAQIAAENGVSPKYLATIWQTLEVQKEDLGPGAKLQALWHALPAPSSNGAATAWSRNLSAAAPTASESPIVAASARERENAEPKSAPIVAASTSEWKSAESNSAPIVAASASEWKNVRSACAAMRDWLVTFRAKLEPRYSNLTGVTGIAPTSEPFLMWKNRQYALHRRSFDPDALQIDGKAKPMKIAMAKTKSSVAAADAVDEDAMPESAPTRRGGDPELTVPKGQEEKYSTAFARFCSVFPDAFYVQERGRNYLDKTKDKGRLLSAGFHNVMGYFRDDQPLYELILDEKGQHELDALWQDMDFVAGATARTYVQFYFNESSEARDASKRAAERDVTKEPMIKAVMAAYVAKAKASGNPTAVQAIEDHFTSVNETLRWTEKARQEAEPIHLHAALDLAARAYRRPLTEGERADLIAFYRSAREGAGLSHEDAMRDLIVAVLMSPDFCYRLDLSNGASALRTASAGSDLQSSHSEPTPPGSVALSDYALASRLSYFLWSSQPDATLLAHAAAGDLHQPKVLVAEAHRMLADPRSRALALEFGGNWLDFRRFEETNTVDRERFPTFTNALRSAMFEEPIRFMQEVFAHNGSVLDFVYADYTYVNAPLARHYGMPEPKGDDWVRVDHAGEYGRGGLLPMAAFLTKNAPGLRTSPVKRGYWVVKRVLGEFIPPPPAVVPELPRDEAKAELPLRDMLAKHREDKSCAACHARFDALGLVFEGYGPVGERRTQDLAGRPIDAHATFPRNASSGEGLAGLREYVRGHRQDDFVDNLCRKLFAYALSRSLILSDDPTITELRANLAQNDYRFQTIIDGIVTSPQFMNRRAAATAPVAVANAETLKR
jgi:hypothetical protein